MCCLKQDRLASYLDTTHILAGVKMRKGLRFTREWHVLPAGKTADVQVSELSDSVQNIYLARLKFRWDARLPDNIVRQHSHSNLKSSACLVAVHSHLKRSDTSVCKYSRAAAISGRTGFTFGLKVHSSSPKVRKKHIYINACLMAHSQSQGDFHSRLQKMRQLK